RPELTFGRMMFTLWVFATSSARVSLPNVTSALIARVTNPVGVPSSPPQPASSRAQDVRIHPFRKRRLTGRRSINDSFKNGERERIHGEAGSEDVQTASETCSSYQAGG